MNKKRILDIIMIILLIFLMAFTKTGGTIHWYLALFMILAMIIHHYWNMNWWKTLFKGKYRGLRIAYLIVNGLMLIDMMILMMSGISLSPLNIVIIPIALARELHVLCGYWMVMLMAIHLGLHMSSIAPSINKMITHQFMNLIVMKFIPIVVIVIGMICFIRHNIMGYLLMGTSFVFFNDDTSLFRYILENLSIFLSISGITHYLKKVLIEGEKS